MWIFLTLALTWAQTLPNEFEPLTGVPGVQTELRYASENNFMKKNVYGDFKTAYLHKDAKAKLVKAVSLLQAAHPGYKLLVLDALRPRHIQRVLFSYVKGTAQESYVADPDKGSVHNYGFAVDLTVVDEKGKELDMGTPYDSFQPLAQPQKEAEFLKKGLLTQMHMNNRKVLREAMVAAGFQALPNEWWHFDAKPIAELKRANKIVE